MGQGRRGDSTGDGRDRSARRRLGMALGGAAAATLLMAAPAGAAPPGGGSASAFWDVGDARQTRVSVQGSTTGGPHDADSRFLFVTQSFCDEGADQMVFRSFLSQGPIEQGGFSVHPRLKSARLKTSTTVTGAEQRVGTCASPSGPVSFTNLGTSSVKVQVNWDATSDVYEVQPGIVARDAVATGTITGSTLSPGPLGSSDTAQIRRTTS